MNRYLMKLSYIGTRFRGIQKSIIPGSGCADDPLSIEGLLEIALRRFEPVNEFKIKLSSRHPKFEIDRMLRVAKQFEGYHDFRTFMSIARGNDRQMDPSYTLRQIDHISIERSISMASVFNRELADKCYEFWDIRIKAKSFLYKQVRRMVGAWIAAAEERISERDIYEMLTIPSQNSWCDRAVVAPAYGLYLCQVEYNPTDLEFSQDELPGTTEEKQTIVTTH
ncbi:tRNA pseudouridine synthase-like 1 isoform X2 [Toxorhynchites rutilus septentrionalis]|uniref:tRNA pseudouridine synthase-like 1 isoform X2 n=1 Tax=Toxorhynchites rutilus septentrionalis TaxID=329112 RepID=UPI00247A75CA|nr:tRNA pseudouridine synthase-like 1 isoform X2 [Toxorhynchites rutilus septentrionalis]